MKFFLFGSEDDESVLLGGEGTLYLIQLSLSGETGDCTAVIKTTSSLPGSAAAFAELLISILSAP